MKILIGVLTLSLLLSACAKDEDDARAVVENPKLLSMSEIQEQSCKESIDRTILNISDRRSWKFDGNSVTYTIDRFSGTNCENPVMTVFYRGTFERQNDLGNQTYQIDYTFNDVVVVPRNEDGVRLLNTANFCGKSDWVLGQEVTLTANSRDALCPLHDLPKTFYDIYQIEGDMVYFGKGDKDSPEKRPNEVDRETPYVKRS